MNEELPPKSEPNKEKINIETSSGSQKSHQYTHEYVYNHNLTKDATENVNNMAL